MKPSFLSLLLLGAVFVTIPSQIVMADDATSSGQPAAADGDQSQRLERLKQALAQLDLTDAQKAQIKQIRASVTDRKERRQQIMAVLTPDQKAKLREMIQEHKNGAQAGAGAAASTGGN